MEIEKILTSILTELRGNRDLLSIRETANYFDTSERSIRRFVHSEGIIVIKIPGIGLRVVRSSLTDYISKMVEAHKEKIIVEQEFIETTVRRAMSKRRN